MREIFKKPKKEVKAPKVRKFARTEDVRYGDPLINRLINSLMWDGKKSVAESIVYKAIEIIKKHDSIPKTLNEPELVKAIIAKVRPMVEVVSRRIRGATYPIPTEVRPHRAEMLALRWIRQGARGKGREMHKALAQEMIDAYNDSGFAMKKRSDLHAMAKASRSWAHFASAR